jgi:hypothetical protein
VELFNEEVSETGTRFRWSALTHEATFQTVAVEDQGMFVGSGGILAVADEYNYIISDTMWDRTGRFPVAGPTSTLNWQAKKALNYTTGPFPEYRIRANRLLFSPIPAASHDIFFEYASKKFVYNPDEDTYGQVFSTNDSVPVLDCDLIMQGVRWRWKMAKGFQYAEEKRTHELDVANASSRDAGRKRLSLAGGNSIGGGQRVGDLRTTQL